MSDNKKDTEIAYSAPDIFGGVTHFNSRGEEIGYSMPDKTGVMVDHDASGNIIGYSAPDIFGGTTHFDAKGGETGYSYQDLMGGTSHRDKYGHDVGFSYTNKTTGISAGVYSGVDNPTRYASTPVSKNTETGGAGSDVTGDPTWRYVPDSDDVPLIVFLTALTLVPLATTAIFLWIYGAIGWFFGAPLSIMACGSGYLLYRVIKAQKTRDNSKEV